MAFTTGTNWDVQTGGDSTNNGGGFDTGVSGFPTDGAATSATGTSPVFTSASYSFVAGDVGAYIYISAGTNWIPGWYKIASVASGAATLTAANGCATTASPSGATWGIDYSQSTTARISFTDLVIDGTTNTKFTSSANPVGKNFIGNTVAITAGTGFTVQRVAIVSTSGTTATCDKSLGTLSSTGGTGGLGGAVATVATADSSAADQNVIWIKSGTYTFTAQISVDSPRHTLSFIGYASTHGDDGTAPLLTTATNSTRLFFLNAGGTFYLFKNLSFSNTATTRAEAIFNWSGNPTVVIDKCGFTGFSTTIVGASGSGISSANFTSFQFLRSWVVSGTSNALWVNGGSDVHIRDSYFYANGSSGSNGAQIYIFSSSPSIVSNNIVAAGNGPGLRLQAGGLNIVTHNTIVNNTGDGLVFGGAWATTFHLEMHSNIIYGNSGLGADQITTSAKPNAGTYSVFQNAYGGNSSGSRSTGIPVGTGEITLTSDPSTSSTDFSLNTAAGGGALCKAAGYPGVIPGSTTTGYLDIGAVQSQGTGGGSSSSGNYGFIG